MDVLGSLAEAFNARDWNGARALLSDDMEFTDVAAGVTLKGADAFVEYGKSWAGAFSDMKINKLATVSDGRIVAGEFSGGGVHDGTMHMPTGDLPATGQTFNESFTWFGEVADGKITGLRDYYNPMSIMVQLGVMPDPAAATV